MLSLSLSREFITQMSQQKCTRHVFSIVLSSVAVGFLSLWMCEMLWMCEIL